MKHVKYVRNNRSLHYRILRINTELKTEETIRIHMLRKLVIINKHNIKLLKKSFMKISSYSQGQ